MSNSPLRRCARCGHVGAWHNARGCFAPVDCDCSAFRARKPREPFLWNGCTPRWLGHFCLAALLFHPAEIHPVLSLEVIP